MRLLPAVTYQGGKTRLAPAILDILGIDESPFYDLCCGSGAISIEAVNRGRDPRTITMVDLSPWGEFWQQIGDGSFDLRRFRDHIRALPTDPKQIKPVIEKLYREPPGEDRVCVFVLLQAAAIGGKAVWIEDNRWWRSSGFRDYWLPTQTSSRRSPVNPMMPMPGTILERVEALTESLRGLRGIQADVRDILPGLRDGLGYIDPPYAGTTGYGYDFDLQEVLSRSLIPLAISESHPIGSNAVCLSAGRSKGGITGERKIAPNQEWLSLVSAD